MSITSTTPASPGTTRRVVIRAGAWVMPVLAVAATAPAFAASPSGRITTASMVYNAQSSKQFDVTCTLAPGGAEVKSLQLLFVVSSLNWTQAGPVPGGWSPSLSSSLITYTLGDLSLAAGASPIAAEFHPVRQSNTGDSTLTVELWINGAKHDTRTFTT